MILKAGQHERPTQARSRECFFFFYPPLNIRPCIIQITLYICTLPLKLEFGVDVFSMLAHQSGIYVRLKIHILLPLSQCLKSLLVAVVGSLVWLVLQPLICFSCFTLFSQEHTCRDSTFLHYFIPGREANRLHCWQSGCEGRYKNILLKPHSY